MYEFGELGLQLKQHEEADLAEAGKQLRGHLEDKALKEVGAKSTSPPPPPRNKLLILTVLFANTRSQLRMGDKAEHSTAPLKTGEFA